VSAVAFNPQSILSNGARELSNGQFSDDNQKKLTGHDTEGVPIFEAKMTRDLRLGPLTSSLQ
jgi:hypothetical protein